MRDFFANNPNQLSEKERAALNAEHDAEITAMLKEWGVWDKSTPKQRAFLIEHEKLHDKFRGLL
jgi:hypothetical protein